MRPSLGDVRVCLEDELLATRPRNSPEVCGVLELEKLPCELERETEREREMTKHPPRADELTIFLK
jgi:hypothetical protein